VRTETILESTPSRLTLSVVEAASLRHAGRRLASDRSWWGEEDRPSERSVIRCEHLAGDNWLVTVLDAVGIVTVGRSLQISVQPKIPTSHFLYLLGYTREFPRFDIERAGGQVDQSLWDLVVEWYLRATETLLRQGLQRDYHHTRDALTVVRGSLIPLATAEACYAGRLEAVCEYDDFSEDTALNRVLKAAAQTILTSPDLATESRRRARRALMRMENIGPLQVADIRTQLDRHTARYANAFVLAIQVLKALGRNFEVGSDPTWTFLIRTPKLVEDGLRALLALRIPAHTIVKGHQRIPGTWMTLNPDLVVDRGLAVADVKYKLTGEAWKRPDLYQVVAFAEGFKSQRGAIIEFLPPSTSALPILQIGDIEIQHFGWSADPGLSPLAASKVLLDAMANWLDTCSEAQGLTSRRPQA
jgi:5-methylcytosine-specific restriction endonuclease McrBC regulatory subunit McrC